MSAPRFVNTTDGMCWTRRKATRDGHELYALAAVEDCPAHLMETYAELEGHGIVGSADVLPVPVGPEVSLPQGRERDELLARYERALAPFCADPQAAAVAVGKVRDHEAEFLLRDAQRSQDRVNALEAERHSRARPSCPCPPENPSAPHQVGCFFDGVPVSPPSERPVDGLTARYMPVAALREASSREEPHDSPLHQAHRLGHDLDVPTQADPGDRLLEGDELRRELRGHLFGGGA